MPRRWTIKEETEKKKELIELYERENKTIGEIGKILGVAESTVFDRMKRLNISSTPERKLSYCNKRNDLEIPKKMSNELAEFIGIMLGDGHVGPTQILISIRRQERSYLEYVHRFIKELFGVDSKYIECPERNTYEVYVGSVEIVRFLKDLGLVSNKVQEQVDIPDFILRGEEHGASFLKGFFDTDGSIYKLKFGVQMGFCNRSVPLLRSTREILLKLKYHPSKISSWKVYLTRKTDLSRYVREIGFGNKKHLKRAKRFGII